MKFNPRLTTPSSNNKYYNSNMNPFVPAGYGMFQNNGNCTTYAYGRFMEEANMSSCKLSTANAEKWYTKNDGYKRGQTPKLGAVACWEGLGSAAGHVAIVEQINSDGTITLSNSGWHYKLFYLTKIKAPYNIGSGYRFQGFIYNPTEFDNEPTPAPTPGYTGTITYQAYSDGWLPEVHKCDNTPEGYAGVANIPMTGIRAKAQYGKIYLQAHIKNGSWLSEVSSDNYSDGSANSFAGILGSPMDMIKIKSTEGFVNYRVKTKEDGWLPWVDSRTTTGTESYAGIPGHTIIGIQMK